MAIDVNHPELVKARCGVRVRAMAMNEKFATYPLSVLYEDGQIAQLREDGRIDRYCDEPLDLVPVDFVDWDRLQHELTRASNYIVQATESIRIAQEILPEGNPLRQSIANLPDILDTGRLVREVVEVVKDYRNAARQDKGTEDRTNG